MEFTKSGPHSVAQDGLELTEFVAKDGFEFSAPLSAHHHYFKLPVKLLQNLVELWLLFLFL